MNKTKTIKKRAIYVYTPSEKIAEEWKKTATESGMSISKFIIEAVEEYVQKGISSTSKNSLLKRIDILKKQIETLQNETVKLQNEVNKLNNLIDRYENLLKQYKNKTFIDNGKFEGVREYQENLIELFKSRSSIAEDEIIDLLHINPRDVETLKAISSQIENLQDYGIIEKIRGGWRWKK